MPRLLAPGTTIGMITALVIGLGLTTVPAPQAAGAGESPRIFRDAKDVRLINRPSPVSWLGFAGNDAWYLSETNAGTIANEFGFGPTTDDDVLSELRKYPVEAGTGDVVDVAVGYVTSDTSPGAAVLRRTADGASTLVWHGPQADGLPVEDTITFPAEQSPTGVEVVGSGSTVQVLVQFPDRVVPYGRTLLALPPDRVTSEWADPGEPISIPGLLDIDHHPSWAYSPFEPEPPDFADASFAAAYNADRRVPAETIIGLFHFDDGAWSQSFETKGQSRFDKAQLRYHVAGSDPGSPVLTYAAMVTSRDRVSVTTGGNVLRDAGNSRTSGRISTCPSSATGFDAVFFTPEARDRFDPVGTAISAVCAGVDQPRNEVVLASSGMPEDPRYDNPARIPLKGLPPGTDPFSPQVDLTLPCQEMWRIETSRGNSGLTAKELLQKGYGCSSRPRVDANVGDLKMDAAGNVAATVSVGIGPSGTAPDGDLSAATGGQAVVASVARFPGGVIPRWRVDQPDRAWTRELPAGLVTARLPGAPIVFSLELDEDCTVGSTGECAPQTVQGNPIPIAVLAAPPSVGGAEQEAAGPPIFARSTSSSTGSVDVMSSRLGAYIGLDLTDPTGANGVELQANYEFETETSATSTLETTQTSAFNGSGEDDVVIFEATRYWEYPGTVITDSTGLNVGTRTTIRHPRSTITSSGDWSGLQREFPDAFGPTGTLAPSMSQLLSHSVGDPGSYLASTEAVDEYCIGGSAGEEVPQPKFLPKPGETSPFFGDRFFDNDLRGDPPPPQTSVLLSDRFQVRAGSANSETAAVEIVDSRETEFLQSHSLDLSAGVVLGYVAAGVTGGITSGSGWTLGVSSGTAFEGTVGNIPSGDLTEETYSWRMFLCKRSVLPGMPVWVLGYQVEDYQGSGGIESLGEVEVSAPKQSALVSRTPTLSFEQAEGTVNEYRVEMEAVGVEAATTLTDDDLDGDPLTWDSTVRSKKNRPSELEVKVSSEDTLQPGQLYRWRAVARDFFGNEEASPWEFFVTHGPPTARIEASSDARGYAVVGRPITVEWSGTAGAPGTTSRWLLPSGEASDGDTATWTPNEAGVFPLRLTVKNAEGSDAVTKNIIVSPNGVPDSYLGREDEVMVVEDPGVLANDDGADRADLVTDVATGTLTLSDDGGFTWSPGTDLCGVPDADGFSYRSRGNGVANPQDAVPVLLGLECVNDAPEVGEPVDDVTTEDTPLEVGAPGLLSAAVDVDGDDLTAVLDGQPQHGTVTVEPSGAWTYTPSPDFCGDDAFTFRVEDAEVSSDLAVAGVTVLCVNDTPVGQPDAGITSLENPVVTVPTPGVLGNDSDVDGDSLTALLVDDPQHGQAVVEESGAWTYTRDEGYCGPDTFFYAVDDGRLASAPVPVELTADCDPPAQPVPAPPTCQGREATIVGTNRSETLRGTPGDDVIVARGGNDIIRALRGNDIVCAGAGRDIVFAGPGRDPVNGGAGRDELLGGRGADVLSGGGGNDTVSGRRGDDTLLGGLGADRLRGGQGRDRCSGGPQRDVLTSCEVRR